MARRVEVRVGRAYESRTDQDGVRVLVDRLWPRGLPKGRADLDGGCREGARAGGLRRWDGHAPKRGEEFARRYRAELTEESRVEALAHLKELAGRGTVTLLTA